MFRLSQQFGRDPTTVRLFSIESLRKKIDGLGEKVFFNSMSDTFHEKIPVRVIADWLAMFAEFPDRQFQVLTKRINRAYALVKSGAIAIPPNVWLGTSIEDKAHLFRADTLRKIPAKIRFISFEPLLSEIQPPINLEGISWVIVGGESDYTTPRPMSEYWAAIIRDEAQRQKVAFFYKQKGGIGGDGAGGDRLMGQTYKEFPKY